MMNPLKLSLLIFGTASVLAVAPSAISLLVPEPAFARQAAAPTLSSAGSGAEEVAELPLEASPAPFVSDGNTAGAVSVKPGWSGGASSREVSLSLPSPDSAAARARETPTPTPVPTPTPIPYRVEIARAQELLGKLGLDVGKVDGKRGQRTEAALRTFQERFGLDLSGDADQLTLGRLQAEVAALATPTPLPPPPPVAVSNPTPAAIPTPLPLPNPVSVAVASGPEVSPDKATVATGSASPDSGDPLADTIMLPAPIGPEPVTITAISATPPVVTVSVPATPAPTPAPTPTLAAAEPADDPQFVVLTADGKVNPPTPGSEAEVDSEVVEAPVVGPLPDLDPDDVPTLRNMKDVRLIQHALYATGVYTDAPDGRWGKKTIAAMREFQEREKLTVTGKPNSETWKILVKEAKGAASKAPKESGTKATTSRNDRTASGSSLPGRLLAQVPSDQGRTAASATASVAADLTVSAPAPARVVPEPAPDSPVQPLRAGEPLKVLVPKSRATVPVLTPVPTEAPPSAPLPVSTPGVIESFEVAASPAEIPVPSQTPDPFAPSPKSTPAITESVPVVAESAPVVAEAIPEKAEVAVVSPVATVRVAPEQESSSQNPLPTPASVSIDAVNSVTSISASEPVEEEELVPSLSLGGRIIAAPDPVANSTAAPAGLAAGPIKTKPTPAAVVVSVPSTKVILPPSRADLRDAEKARELAKQVVETKALVEAAENDKTLELAKHAPNSLKSASRLLQQAEKELEGTGGKANPVAAEKSLKAGTRELDMARTTAMKARAGSKVAEVEASYDQLKSRFSQQIRKSSELADVMTKIDGGFEAMNADLKKENFEPILLRADGFKLSIDKLAHDAAAEYLKTELAKRTVKQRLKKDVTAKIAALEKKEDYLAAADLLDKTLKKK